jgi:MPBQ/MSBQ methyltransferase
MNTFAARYDQVISAPAMQRLYGASGYFNVGYWVDGIGDLTAACDRLVDELAAGVPAAASVIVDVGCGLGAGTCRLARRFSRALVIGANLSRWQLGVARGRGVAAPVVMDATRMALASGTVDAVLAIESPQHFQTRAAFLAEAYRVLRPGGVLAVADMLFASGDAIGSWMLPPDNRITTVGAYEKALADAAFGDIAVRDITAQSWRPFCVALRGVMPEETAHAIERSLACYVLGFARRG